MIKLLIKGEEVNANASILTTFIYRQEFNREMLADSLMATVEEDLTTLSRITWAMIKTANNRLETYIQWSSDLREEDIINNKEFVIYEIHKRVLFDIEDNKRIKSNNKKKVTKDIELGMIKNIIDLNVDLDIVNLLSVGDFIKLQDMYIGENEGSTLEATPEQTSAFFLG